MSENELMTLATYPDEGSAAIARSALAGTGIPVFIVDGATTTTLWHVGTALGGVRLQVPASHVDEARRVLNARSAIDDENLPTQAWICPQCHAEVDAGFGICWSCGTAVPEAIAESSATANASNQEPTEPPLDSSDKLPSETRPHVLAKESDQSTVDAEARATRAWRAALVSIVLPFAAPYAALLLIRLTGDDLSPTGTRKFYGSVIIVLVMFCAMWALFNPFY